MAAFLNRPEMLSYENPLNQAIRDFQGITSPDPAHVLRRLAAKSRREEECTGGFSPAACLQTAALARKAAMQAARCAGAKGPSTKGIGPNKACGHKGGIRRQGSKRG